MAFERQGHLIPVLLLISFFNLATSYKSRFISNLHKNNGELNNPIVVALENAALAEQLVSGNLNSDLDDFKRPNKNTVPYVYIYQLGQAKSNNDELDRPNQERKERNPRFYNRQYMNKRYKQRYDDRHDRDHRDRYRNYYEDRYQRREDRHRQYRHPRYDYQYSRPLRTDDKNQKEQDDNDRRNREQDKIDRRDRAQDQRVRTDRNQQQKQDREDDRERGDRDKVAQDISAQSQIPVLKSLLRTLNCNARDECQDTCNGIEMDDCEDECEIKYECENEEEDEEDSCETCNNAACDRPKCTGSTKGERLQTNAPTCKRC